VAGPPSPEKPGFAGAGDCGNHGCHGIDASNDVILHFDKQKITFGIEADFVGFVEFCKGGGTTIALVAFFPVPTTTCD
jgi:hypothetical protein